MPKKVNGTPVTIPHPQNFTTDDLDAKKVRARHRREGIARHFEAIGTDMLGSLNIMADLLDPQGRETAIEAVQHAIKACQDAIRKDIEP